MKKNIIAATFLIFIVISIIFCIATNLFINYRIDNSINNSISNAKSAAQVIINSLNIGILNSDEIALINGVQYLIKIPSISSAFVLDKNGKVIVHNDINQMNSIKSEAIYNNALKKQAEMLQKTDNSDVLLLSYPLTDNFMLFCLLSNKSNIQNINNLRSKYYCLAIIVSALLSVFIFFILKLLVSSPLENLKNKIKRTFIPQDIMKNKNQNTGIKEKLLIKTENLLNANIEEHYQAIMSIFSKANEQNNKTINRLESENNILYETIEAFVHKNLKDSSVFIALDTFNNIIMGFDKNNKVLKTGFKKRDNIIEAAINTNIFEAIERVTQYNTPNKIFKEIIDEVDISLVFTGNGLIISNII
jgi:hypothetical protein